jgi:hypothetical protein
MGVYNRQKNRPAKQLKKNCSYPAAGQLGRNLEQVLINQLFP